MSVFQQRRMWCPVHRALLWAGLACLPLVSACGMGPHWQGDHREPRVESPLQHEQETNHRIILMPPKKPQAPSAAVTTESLIGQTIYDVEAALGRPASVHDEKPAVVYRYQATGCELKLIFFMDIERQQFRVLSYDIAATRAENPELQACLNEIAAIKTPL